MTGMLGEPAFACVCCGLLTLDERPPGTWLICPGCGWEDDPAQCGDPDLRGGANAVSLREGRENYARHGICDVALQRVDRGTPGIRLEFRAPGNWAVVSIAHARRGCVLTVGWGADALGDLIAGVNRVLGGEEAEFGWADEMGAWLWRLRRRGARVEVRVARADLGRVEFEGACELVDFAREVDRAVGQLLAMETAEEYEAKMGRAFPAAAWARLRAILSYGRGVGPPLPC